MSQSYGHVYVHLVFSTKNREPLLTRELHVEFARYLKPILEGFHVRFIAEGGMPDHVHLLVDLGREVSVSQLLREIKANSSRWLKVKTRSEFSWQRGYGVFSVSPHGLQSVVRYIRNQEVHHLKQTFEAEFETMLSSSGVAFEPAELWRID